MRGDVTVGDWWRFDRYEVRDGYIRPAPRAKLQRYDPWEAYQAGKAPGRKRRKQAPPYQSLLDILQKGSFFPLEPESEKNLLQWCSAHGLLGIVPHEALMVTLWPCWEPIQGIATDDPMLLPTAYRYVRTNAGWIATHIQMSLGERGYKKDKEPKREGELVSEEDIPKSLPPRGVIFQSVGKAELKQELLGYTWARFFPDVSPAQRETFRYPVPLSEAFWHLYAEPLDAFVNAAVTLRNALYGLAHVKPLAEASTEENSWVLRGEKILHALLAPVTPALELLDDGKFRQRWVSTSLLASYAMMAFLDLVEERPLRCEVCGKLFVSGAYQARYCSPTCRHTAQKRAYRERRKREIQAKIERRKSRQKKGGL